MNSRFSMLGRTYMKVVRFVKQIGFSVFGALVFLGLPPSSAVAQDHNHLVMSQAPQTAEQKKQDNELVATVREVTERYQDVSQVGPDFSLLFGCVSGGDYGAMGLHRSEEHTSELQSLRHLVCRL